MRNIGFFKKEIKELFKTPRFIILMSIFVFFGIMSPLTGRYFNEILSLMSSDIDFALPDPTFKDAWMQFYKNITTLCIIVYLIIMTGGVAQEKAKGSIMLVLTKKVSRTNFLVSKFCAGVFLYTICFIGSLVVSVIYTQILFGEVYYSGLIVSLVLSWLIGIFYTSLALFASIIAKSATIAALYGFAFYAVLNLFNIIRGIEIYNPAGIPNVLNSLLAGTSSTADNIISITTAVVISALIFIAGIFIFKKQEV